MEGYLYLSATSQDNFRIVFNEQVLNPDGSVTVNVVHEYFLGPVLKGDMALGQSVCRWGPTTIHSVKAVADFDGNGATDYAVYRPSQGVWYVQGGTTIAYGAPATCPSPATTTVTPRPTSPCSGRRMACGPPPFRRGRPGAGPRGPG